MSQTNEPRASAAVLIPLPSRVVTRSGAILDPSLDVWRWTDGPSSFTIDFTRYRGGYERHVFSLKNALVPVLRGNSGHHVTNLESTFRLFTELTGPCPSGAFTAADLANFAAKLDKSSQWRVGTLNGLVQKWVALGLEGMLPADC
jgi:hypothetical protein